MEGGKWKERVGNGREGGEWGERDKKGGEGREKGGRTQLGYLFRGPRVTVRQWLVQPFLQGSWL